VFPNPFQLVFAVDLRSGEKAFAHKSAGLPAWIKAYSVYQWSSSRDFNNLQLIKSAIWLKNRPPPP
jgi:hypothetical protein